MSLVSQLRGLVGLVFVGVLAGGLSLSGCYPRIAPTSAVEGDPDRFLGPPQGSGVAYESAEPSTTLPVLPFRLWGLHFDEEMLFEFADHPRFGMVEVARVRTREGAWAWFGLVAELSGTQHVAVGSPEHARLGQSFPAPVYDGGLVVERTQEGNEVEYVFSFTLPGGETLEGSVRSRLSGGAPPARNGNAMNHSRERVLAVLDLEEFNWARPSIRIDGEPARVRSLAPGLRYSFRLRQAAGGMAAGHFTQGPAGAEPPPSTEDLAGGDSSPITPETAGGESPPPSSAASVPDLLLVEQRASPGAPLAFALEEDGEGFLLVSQEAVVDLRYRFVARSDQGLRGPVELVEAEVRHGDRSAFRVRFNPSLPDLRYPLDSDFEGRMIAGANGQEGYMTGKVRVQWGDGEAVVDFLPDQPFWACERPIRSQVRVQGGVAQLRSEVRPDLAAGGKGAEVCFQDRR